MSDIKVSENIEFGTTKPRSMPSSYAVLALEAGVVLVAIALTTIMVAGIEASLPAESQLNAIDAAIVWPYWP